MTRLQQRQAIDNDNDNEQRATHRWQRHWRTALAVVLVAVGAFAFGLRQVPATPSDTSAAAGFSRDMSVHHDQAVQMAEVARSKSADPLVRGLATEVVLIQQAQIGQMRGWLDVWGLSPTGNQPRMAWMGTPVSDFSQMPGMSSQEEMRALEQLSPAQIDVPFLQMMIRHHQGGVQMAQAGLALVDQSEVRALANAVVTSQQYEIQIMNDLLQRKGAQPVGDLPSIMMSGGGEEAEGFTTSVRPVLTETLKLTPVMLGILAAAWLLLRWLPGATGVGTVSGETIGLWRGVAVVGLLASAFLHLGLAPAHFEESRGFGIFFTVSAVVLAVIAVALLLRPTPMVYLAGVASTLFLVVMYLLFRVVPPPGMDEVEGFDLIGIVTKVAEIAALVGCAVVWMRSRGVHGDTPPDGSRRVALER